MEKNALNDLIKSKFLCQDKFSNAIETIVSQNPEMNYIEAICQYCEENNLEVESVPKLISKPLKEKLKYNSVELNYLKKTSRAKLII